jgi:hypothetical protein
VCHTSLHPCVALVVVTRCWSACPCCEGHSLPGTQLASTVKGGGLQGEVVQVVVKGQDFGVAGRGGGVLWRGHIRLMGGGGGGEGGQPVFVLNMSFC